MIDTQPVHFNTYLDNRLHNDLSFLLVIFPFIFILLCLLGSKLFLEILKQKSEKLTRTFENLRIENKKQQTNRAEVSRSGNYKFNGSTWAHIKSLKTIKKSPCLLISTEPIKTIEHSLMMRKYT